MALLRHGRVCERRNLAHARHGLSENFQPLAVKLRRQQADAGGIATRARKRLDQTCPDHVFRHGDERNGTGELLQHACVVVRPADNDVGRGFH